MAPTAPWKLWKSPAAAPPSPPTPLLCLALSQPWEGVRGVKWREKRGRALTTGGQAL